MTPPKGRVPSLSNEPVVSFRQGEHRASGVVLRGRGEGKSRALLLFLKGHGALWVSAPGSGAGRGAGTRFGGGDEPMMWGDFLLYKSPRMIYLKGADVKEDFFGVRRSRRTLRTALGWCGELSKRIAPGTPNDSLLSLFWGGMKNLTDGAAPDIADARFLWRWCNIWGVAPELASCVLCGAAFGADLIADGSRGARLAPDGLLCVSCAGNGRFSEPVMGDGRQVIWDGRQNAAPAIANEDLLILQRAATLPRERFVAWARDAQKYDAERVSEWLRSFLKKGEF
ncbi:hypothetical protein FACS1894216_22100 [Synergistales bacterium]|nr:hypothetical protein FACS1894216_22100 [Synergistales bacterium]